MLATLFHSHPCSRCFSSPAVAHTLTHFLFKFDLIVKAKSKSYTTSPCTCSASSLALPLPGLTWVLHQGNFINCASLATSSPASAFVPFPFLESGPHISTSLFVQVFLRLEKSSPASTPLEGFPTPNCRWGWAPLPWRFRSLKPCYFKCQRCSASNFLNLNAWCFFFSSLFLAKFQSHISLFFTFSSLCL